MAETKISLGNFKPTCPQCGAELLVERLGDKPEPHDRVFCPVHGTIGTSKQVGEMLIKQDGSEVRTAIENKLRDIFGGGGFKPK